MTRNIQDLLVISDMDGTLLAEDLTLPSCNLETIRLFTRLGGRFTVGTGRVAQSVQQYPELVECISPAITCNGCVLYDFKENKPLKCELVPRAVAKMAILDITRHFPGAGVIIFAADGMRYIYRASEQAKQLFDDEQLPYVARPLEDMPPEWNKVIFAGPPELLNEIEQWVSERSYPGAYFVMSSLIYFEMLPEGVSKGSALKDLCALLGVKQENVIVIGDYYNDLEMMRLAGHSVAMDNAPADVKLAAAETTGGNSAGGVGEYLYRLIRELGL